MDVEDPSTEELKKVAAAHLLPDRVVTSCLNPGHLPKHEKVTSFGKDGEIHFLIIRSFDDECHQHSRTMKSMTRKIALFMSHDFLITIHRKPHPLVREIRKKWSQASATEIKKHSPLADIFHAIIGSFRKPIDDAEIALSHFEAALFARKQNSQFLQRIYHVIRRMSVTKRMLLHAHEIIRGTKPHTHSGSPLTPSQLQAHQHAHEDLAESAQNLYVYTDEILEDLNHLLSIQISLASHRTNEVMRVLTLFSVFFMPLTFIAGVYGMNFKFMPELDWQLGYPMILLFMGSIVLGTFLWFRKRGWLG